MRTILTKMYERMRFCARYRPDGFLNMDVTRLKDLDWKAEVSLDEMFSRMIAGIWEDR